MADQNKIVYNIQVNAEQGTATIRDLKGQIVATQVPLDQLRGNFGNFAKQVNAVEFKKFNKGLKSATSANAGLASASGGATTSVLELGRVVSDAPYGIRGMANNVSQLASNMLFTAQQVDKTTGKVIGFSGVLKDMGKVFLGPLGLLFLIQGAIALLDGFYGANKKAEDSADKASKSIGGQATKLLALRDALEDNSMSREEANEAIEAANKEFKELNLKLDENNKLTDDSVIAINNKIEALVNLSKAQALQSLLEQKYSELLPLQAKQQELDTEAKKANAKAMKQLNTLDKRFTAETQINNAARAESAAKENARAAKEIEKDIADLLKLGGEDGIIDLMFKGAKGRRGKRDRAKAFDTKQLQKDSLAYVKELMKVDEKIALLSAKDKKSRLIIQRDFHLKRLIAAHGANSELVKSYKKYYRQLIQIAEEGELEILAKEGAKGMGGAPRNTTTDAEIIKERQRLLTQVKLEALMESSQAIASFMDGEFQREITIERNKTNALNNELRERLNNENLSKSERKSIQLEIARNDEALRKKQEIAEKKRFKMQKAANISQALISTYLAVAQVQANPLDLNPVTKGISMAATLAAGLANVATLARQKFQSSAGATSTAGALGGGGGSNGADRSFNFNLAGASQENQLAQTLQGRFDQPLQAYVVSRDITNQQQLDQDILSNASFG